MTYWERYSYNFDSYECSDSTLEQKLNKEISKIVNENDEPALYEFLSCGGMYIRDNEDGTFSYASCRIDENAGICIDTGSISREEILDNTLFAEYAKTNEKTPAEYLESDPFNAASYIMEQRPQEYFSRSPFSVEKAVEKLKEAGLFNNDFYDKSVQIIPTENNEYYRYALYARGRDNEFSERYSSGDGFCLYDDVISAVRDCEKMGLYLEPYSQFIEEYISSDFQVLGGTIAELVSAEISELENYRKPQYSSEMLNKTYSKVISEIRGQAEKHKDSINAEIEENWDWCKDYRYNPEEYYDIVMGIAKNIVQYRFEEIYADEIAEIYAIENKCDKDTISLNRLHKEIPSEFFDKIYDLSDMELKREMLKSEPYDFM